MISECIEAKKSAQQLLIANIETMINLYYIICGLIDILEAEMLVNI